MAEIFYDNDADLEAIQAHKVAIIGFGAQAQAHALNLRDSGVDIQVGLEEKSALRTHAEDLGFTVGAISSTAAWADLIAVLIPEAQQAAVFSKDIAPVLTPGKTLLFETGFAVRFGQIALPEGVDVCLVAPQASGDSVRREFESGRGVPALVAVKSDASGGAWETVLSYTKALGCTHAGAIRTTFAERVDSALFAEQSVTHGGLNTLVTTGFEVLVEAGYQPEIAYFAVMHDLKEAVDTLWENGLAAQRRSASTTAEFEDYVSGSRIIDAHVKENMQAVLAEVQNETFTERVMKDRGEGDSELERMRASASAHPIDIVGENMRALFSWSMRRRVQR